MLRTAAKMGTVAASEVDVRARWPPSTPPARIFPGSGWHPHAGPSRASAHVSLATAAALDGSARTDSLAEPGGDNRPQSQASATGPAVAAAVRVRPDLTAPYVAPRTPLEAEMVESWSAILRIEGIGIHDNFFELGGDSLQATILLNRLEEHLGEGVPGHALFQVQTIGDLADYLREHCPRRGPAAIPRRSGRAGRRTGAARRVRPEIARDGGDVSIPRLARDQQAEDLLARLDELSDDEVELLLGQAADDGEADHE